MAEPFTSPREAAQRLLKAAWHGDTEMTPKAGQFLGQLSISDEPLSERQAAWIDKLLVRASLPPLANGGRP